MAINAPNTGAPTCATLTPFAAARDRYRAALARFNGLPEDLERTDAAAFRTEEEIYCVASRAMDRAVPETWADLIIKLEHMIGGGSSPGREQCDELIAEARHLIEKPPVMAAVDLARLDQAMERVGNLSTTIDLLGEAAEAQGASKLSAAMRGQAAAINDQMEEIDEVLEPHRRAMRHR